MLGRYLATAYPSETICLNLSNNNITCLISKSYSSVTSNLLLSKINLLIYSFRTIVFINLKISLTPLVADPETDWVY